MMQLLKHVTLTLCQQQHPDEVLLPRRGTQSLMSNGRIGENGKNKQRILNLNSTFTCKSISL